MSSDQKKIGSLKDRIARFDNPDAEPVVPRNAFGYGGSARKESGSTTGRGLIGNRIPSYNARNVPPELFVAGKKPIENRGLYGNRISGVSDHERSVSSTYPSSTVKLGRTDRSDVTSMDRPFEEERCHQPAEESSRVNTPTAGENPVASKLTPGSLPSTPAAPVARATGTDSTSASYDAKLVPAEAAGVTDRAPQQQECEEQSNFRSVPIKETEVPTSSNPNHPQSAASSRIASNKSECEEGTGRLLADAVQNTGQPAFLLDAQALATPDSLLLARAGSHVDALGLSDSSAVSSTIAPSLKCIGGPFLENSEAGRRIEPEEQGFRSVLVPTRSDREVDTSPSKSVESSPTGPEEISDAAVTMKRNIRSQLIEAGSRDKAVEFDSAGFGYSEQPAVGSHIPVESENRVAPAEQDPVNGAAGFHDDFLKTRKGQSETQAH